MCIDIYLLSVVILLLLLQQVTRKLFSTYIQYRVVLSNCKLFCILGNMSSTKLSRAFDIAVVHVVLHFYEVECVSRSPRFNRLSL